MGCQEGFKRISLAKGMATLKALRALEAKKIIISALGTSGSGA